MNTILQDLRYGVRMLFRNAGFGEQNHLSKRLGEPNRDASIAV